MRYLQPYLLKDLHKKMVFLTGPRQSGKTTLSQALSSSFKSGVYLNYDRFEHRTQILKQQWDQDADLIIFDEVHKYAKWKNLVKGYYDTLKNRHQFLVTGSARLNIFRRGQDSLLGRYHKWRLHPFCLAENPLKINPQQAMYRLLERGGFPEPFLTKDESDAQRWKLDHIQLILREDVRDLTRVRETSLLDLFLTALRERVGSILVMAHLAHDLEIAPKTAKAWLDVIEELYLIFVVKPFAKGIDRGLVVPPKVYFYNNAEVIGDIGSRFENLVGTHLLKRCHFLEDLTGEEYDLRYVRDKEKREVDFLVLKNKKPYRLFECKWAEEKASPALAYFAKKLNIPKPIQLVGELERNFSKNEIQIFSAAKYLSRPLIDGF
jgi:uncharacterized protein